MLELAVDVVVAAAPTGALVTAGAPTTAAAPSLWTAAVTTIVMDLLAAGQ